MGQPPAPGLSLSAAEFIPAGEVLSDMCTPHVGVPPGVLASQQVSGRGEAMEPVSTMAAAPQDALSVAQQLPTLPNFNGDRVDGDRESFDDWFTLYKMIYNLCYFENGIFTLSTTLSHSAHHNLVLNRPFARTNSYLYSFVPHTISIWNNSFVCAPSLSSFKSKLHSVLLM